MADETKPEAKPKTAKQQAHIDAVLKPRAFKPGQSGNPLGRPPGLKSVTSKRMSKFSQMWGRADAPDDWFGEGLAFAKKQGLTVDELIVIRAKWCLAMNVQFKNTSLLKEFFDRSEGKIPLRVLHKPGEEGADDFEELSNQELNAMIEDVDRRARLAQTQQPAQLTDGDAPAEETKEPDAAGTDQA
jgi:hypothetical protein